MMIAVRRDVVSETREGQRPWEQGSLLERFEFVPGGEPVALPGPAVGPAPATEVAALERSVGDKGAVEALLRRDYLAPDTTAMRDAVKRLYEPSATIFGTRYDSDAIVKLKTDWVAQFASWSFGLEPGTLELTPQGDDRANAVFVMAYDYLPKDRLAARLTGKARVTLGLVMRDGQWRIASETSEAMK
jgi:uncharacterized caspase-like protein